MDSYGSMQADRCRGGGPRAPAHRHAALRALCALAAAFPMVAGAHDTWLEPRASAPGRVELALTTGELFPTAQTPVAARSLVDRGCMSASGRRVPLHAAATLPTALTLRAAVPARGDPIGQCWVQTEAFDVEVPQHLVPTYLREIAASDDIRRTWAEHVRQGLPWQERYTKHARISLGEPQVPAPAVNAAPMALDIAIETAGRWRAGETLHFQVLRDGRPLAGQTVELRGEASRFGLWRRTDAEGRASVPVPFPGRWVLRATDLRPRAGHPGHWESRFVTHAFSVGPAEAPAAEARSTMAAQDQPKSPSMPNARSANHQSATTTMSAEPPISTAWR